MNRYVFILMLLFSPFALAQENCDNSAEKNLRPVIAAIQASVTCPDPEKLTNICSSISSFDKDPTPRGEYSYMYQRKIYDAACVDFDKDSEAQIKAKIQKMWSSSDHKLKCHNLQFDVIDGNILKFAVRKRFKEFLEDAVFWKVNLNRVDESDQRTVLDYVRDELSRTTNPSTRSTLEAYYTILRGGGAKHKSEL
jgi:hypothetical protein